MTRSDFRLCIIIILAVFAFCGGPDLHDVVIDAVQRASEK